MSNKKLVIIDNEKVSRKENSFYCDNFEARTSEDFSKDFDVTVIARKSKIDRAHLIKLNKVVYEPLAISSLGIADKFNFAHTQLKIANKLKSLSVNVPLKYHYL